MSHKRIGRLLIEQGVLDEAQVIEILAEQRRQPRPFGKLAYQLFGVAEEAIWEAWLEQVGPCCQPADLDVEPADDAVLALVSAEEAWRLHVLPMRYQGGELIAATTVTDLPEAAALLADRLDHTPHFLVPERRQLERAIIDRYQIVAIEGIGDHEHHAAVG
jgi:hypothetical protein